MTRNRQHPASRYETNAVAPVEPVSERVRVLHEARRAVLDSRPNRKEWLTELSRKVRAGTYCVDGRSVAAAIARQSTGSRVA